MWFFFIIIVIIRCTWIDKENGRIIGSRKYGAVFLACRLNWGGVLAVLLIYIAL
jgi:hypothetical protein